VPSPFRGGRVRHDVRASDARRPRRRRVAARASSSPRRPPPPRVVVVVVVGRRVRRVLVLVPAVPAVGVHPAVEPIRGRAPATRLGPVRGVRKRERDREPRRVRRDSRRARPRRRRRRRRPGPDPGRAEARDAGRAPRFVRRRRRRRGGGGVGSVVPFRRRRSSRGRRRVRLDATLAVHGPARRLDGRGGAVGVATGDVRPPLGARGAAGRRRAGVVPVLRERSRREALLVGMDRLRTQLLQRKFLHGRW
jgi:hypothetical protein